MENVKESSILVVDKVMASISTMYEGMEHAQAAPPRAVEEAGG